MKDDDRLTIISHIMYNATKYSLPEKYERDLEKCLLNRIFQTIGDRTALNFLPINKSAGSRRAISSSELRADTGNSGTEEEVFGTTVAPVVERTGCVLLVTAMLPSLMDTDPPAEVLVQENRKTTRLEVGANVVPAI